MKKIGLLLVLSLNIHVIGGTGITGDGRIQVGIFSEGNILADMPKYKVDGTNLIELPAPQGYTGYSYRISASGEVIIGQLFKLENGFPADCKGVTWRQTSTINGTPYYGDFSLQSTFEEYRDLSDEQNWVSDLSLNGNHIVGSVRTPFWNQYDRPAYWDQNGNIQSLGSMVYDGQIYEFGRANSVSGNKIILGDIYGENTTSSLGFVWDEQHGMRYIKNVLEQEYGYNFGDSILYSAYFRDIKCTIIQGNGYAATGEEFSWQATIPEPASLLLLGLGGLFLRRKN